LINHNQVFFQVFFHICLWLVNLLLLTSDLWLMAYCRMALMLSLQWVAVLLRLCDWPIREESIVYYAQRLVRRRVAMILQPRLRSIWWSIWLTNQKKEFYKLTNQERMLRSICSVKWIVPLKFVRVAMP